MFRIGHGYDVHKLVEGRKLILGGVDIPHTVGLLGHSDADVLLHAVMHSML
jgi:2-C-methyl-D-erythritol 2,4-cyclodiphosphate synthase